MKYGYRRFEKLKRKLTTLKGMCPKIINSITMKVNETDQDFNLQEIKLSSEKLKINERRILDVEIKIESLTEDLGELQKELES